MKIKYFEIKDNLILSEKSLSTYLMGLCESKKMMKKEDLKKIFLKSTLHRKNLLQMKRSEGNQEQNKIFAVGKKRARGMNSTIR